MDSFETGAAILAHNHLLGALISFLEHYHPEIREKIGETFQEALAEITQIEGDKPHERQTKRAIEVILEIVRKQSEGPKLTLVPRDE
ncbi:hypothetical protein NE850_11665 [Paraburkholderia sp. USG1]|uniref:hypothetical protein n=1 Tax=Paraburkholderia sp. USG1 TaxID=2952268 RepID=UPI00285DE02C|nr:hypothetical protein [Paraburkholderia sp. USG1]MDR8396997.1 hypothetical protein [Paraburkholderia sp. USG1]